MSKIRFLFYGPVKGKGVDIAISLWTKGLAAIRGDFRAASGDYDFSHMETWFPNEHGVFESGIVLSGESIYLGTCFSSTMRGDADGVRFAPASRVLRNPERWYYIEFEIADWQLNVARSMAEGKVGKKYDLWGGIVFGFVLPIGVIRQDPEKEYCSEVCCWIAVGVRILKKFKTLWVPYSPRKAASEMSKKAILRPLKMAA